MTFTGITGNNRALYADTTTGVTTGVTATSTSLQCLMSGASAPSWGNCPGSGSGGSKWTELSGLLYPNNATNDVLIGGTTTSSAKFAFLNVASGTPTASVSANSGNNAAYLTGDGTLATTNRGTLTIGNSAAYNTTGNVLINPNGTGNVGIGTTSPGALLDVGLAGTTLGVVRLAGNTSGNVAIQPAAAAGTWTFTLPASGGTNTYALTTNGSGVSSWSQINLATAVTGILPTANGGSFWNSSLGVLYPGNSTLDLLIGGTASSSAKFAVLNINSGTPTASVSAGTAGGAYLNATGTLATTAKQSLTLGGGDTGNIVLSGFSTGLIHSNASGVLSSSAVNLATSDVTGILPLANGGTSANLTAVNGGIVYSGGSALAISAAGTSNQCLLSGGAGAPTWGTCDTSLGSNLWDQALGTIYPNNSTLDLLVGGTASSSAKFAVLNINSGTPTASVSAGTARSLLKCNRNSCNYCQTELNIRRRRYR